MDKDTCVYKALRDLKLQGLVSEKANGEVKMFLEELWVAGWEKARTEFAERTQKAVVQLDTAEHQIGEDASIEKAAKRMKCSRETIARAIRTGNKTVRGHIWKFKDNGNDNNSK